MTEYELDHFQSEFDPQAMARSLAEDSSLPNKQKEFALLKTSFFLTWSMGPGKVAVLHNKQKEAMVAAFTCREEMDKWPFDRGEPQEHSFAELQRMVKREARLDGLVIDPFGKGMALRRRELADMDAALAAANPGKKLRMRATRDYPIGLPLAVREMCARHPEVYRVWVLEALAQEEQEPHKLMVVDFDGKGEQLYAQLAEGVRLYLREGERLEIRKADLNLLQAAERASRPIYEKE